ncbi:uncharacterized protein TNIN_337531 [Trichonephila inaurata madagascariensis]|uniref:BESS domain-containing protein n=1 Tax=Trichonephila inaurata madagascariensis TaxID=2747483 RepID=A0A8X6WU75_9ARAC|nr:uncharacterized protein TNIN_337531 [Trichonephila inaurata madagascariensis]
MTDIENFIKQYHLLLDRCTSKSVAYLRSIINSEREADKFVELFSEKTKTKWIPHDGLQDSEKFLFHKTWLCHRTWRKKGKSNFRDDDCNAKIDIFIKKPDPVYIRHDEYLKMTEEVKEQFFKYFDSGLSVIHARRKHDFLLKLKSTSFKSSKLRFNPTLRQTQHLYNHWQRTKHSVGATLKEADSKFRPVTFEEFLKAVPKKELLRPSKNLEPKHQTTSPISTVQSNQFPLVFVSTGRTGNLPSNEAPLLFKLKYGMGEFVSDLIVPRLYSVCIDSFSVKKDKLTVSMNNGQSSECSSNSEEILIKEEPLDSDEESIDETSLNSRNVKESSIMPVIIKAYSCEDSSTATENGASVAGSFNFPLKFVLAGSINDSSVHTRPLVYVLKQGSNGIYVTRDAMPQIFSVQINSSNQATFKVTDDANAFKTEGPLNVQVKVERSPKNSSVVSHGVKVKEEPLPLPVILNVSTCNNNLLSDTYGSEISNETENEELVSSDIKNCAVSSNGHLGNDCKSASEINYNTNDEDYRFLLSLLPDLKRLPPNEKNTAKKKIQDIILTSRLISSKVQFEKRNTNIYRDCGVLPISGGWKF